MLGWSAPPAPTARPIGGRYCRLEPLNSRRHGPQLFDAFSESSDGSLWTYLGYGPFRSMADYLDWIDSFCSGDDPIFYAVIDQDNDSAAVGQASYLRIQPPFGSIEVGHICYAPRLQRRRAATEAMYLLMREAFELGYRRYEWKCDSLNGPSRRAAERLGFQYEGTFRQAMIYKGRNRDTAWYSITNQEWPGIEQRFVRWLDPGNFEEDGSQRTSL
jgi:RimJ/RimL family protein N-acetyltransferase